MCKIYNRKVLLLLATAFALGLGWFTWQAHNVRVRLNWSEAIRIRGGAVYFHRSVEPQFAHLSPLPWYRRLLGDRAVVWIHLYPNCSKTEKAAMQSVFPEAKAIKDHSEPEIAPYLTE
jgi:hypothetical protein